MRTKVYFGEEARQKLLAGVETVFKAVSPTLGSRGRNAALTRWGKPLIINDGVTIARKIVLEDPGENMGADYIKEVAERTNEEAGDGTTTATILAYYLITEGFNILKANPELSPLKLRQELDEALKVVLKKLEERSNQVEDDEELVKIARISSDNDQIAKLVTKAFRDAGDTGRVVVEESQGLKTEMEKVEGMEVEGGYISSFFITKPETSEAVLDNPYVLVSDKLFGLQNDIIPLMEDIKRSGSTNLVIVCKDAQGEALGCMVGNKLKGIMNVIAVKAPRDKEMLKDLANLCGRQEAWTDENTIHKANLSHCSVIRKVVATKDKTLFIKGDRNDSEKSVFNVRVGTLKELVSSSHGEDKYRYEDRLARLTGSVVLIRVGAASSTEIVYERLKIEDAVNAVKSAVKEGYVTGGGVALLDVCRETSSELKSHGAAWLSLAAEQPVRNLILNSGLQPDMTKINATDGFNTETGKYEKNIMDKGIIDPVLVEKRALVNACSLAGLVLTLETLIVDIPEPRV